MNSSVYSLYCVHAKSPLSCVTPWTVAHQGPLSMGFTRQEYWSGLLCIPPGYLPDQGIEPVSLTSRALADGFFTTSITWKAHSFIIQLQNIWLVLFYKKIVYVFIGLIDSSGLLLIYCPTLTSIQDYWEPSSVLVINSFRDKICCLSLRAGHCEL